MEFLGFTIDVANLTSNALSLVIKVALAILIFVVGRWLAKGSHRCSQNDVA